MRTLRARLTATVVVLLLVSSTAVGVVTFLALRSFLEGRLDDQLRAAGQRSGGVLDRAPGGPHGGNPDTDGDGDFLLAPGQSVGTLGATIAGGAVSQARVLVDARSASAVRDTGPLLRLPADSRPHTVTVDGRRYRAVAVPRGATTVVTGLPLADVDDVLHRLLLSELVIAAAGVAVVGVAGTLTVRRELLPLSRVAATASRVTELELGRGEVELADRVPERDTDPRNEVGQVGGALNALLGHVELALASRQASEQRVRRFVADASHELRTPLSSIKGYAELTRLSPEALPADATRALARIESEAGRMTGLVEDLLLLARLDSGRPLELADVDVTEVLVDATSDVQAAGGDHHWRLDLPPEPVHTLADRGRLQQVLLNLLTNARVHTPPGTTVTAGLTADGDGVTITVTDDGPGIPADQQPELFERFARGDASRSRHAGSTGLGLAIVRAVVSAHGGTTAVESLPGRTTFTVHIPDTHVRDRS